MMYFPIFLFHYFRTKGERSLSIPKSGQEFKEIVYNKMMPESLTKPCVVRCKVIWARFKNLIHSMWYVLFKLIASTVLCIFTAYVKWWLMKRLILTLNLVQVEDPEILLRHQQVQQSKSIHELSKIRNLNEFPLPLNLRLPDLPLPSAKKMLKLLARWVSWFQHLISLAEY